MPTYGVQDYMPLRSGAEEESELPRRRRKVLGQTVCNICRQESRMCYNYGAYSCRACAAFFRRTVKSGISYACKQNEHFCGTSSVYDMRAVHACKNCRFQRCVEEGMKAALLRDPTKSIEYYEMDQPPLPLDAPRPQTPILSAMVTAVKAAFQHRRAISLDREMMIGTSEPWPNRTTNKTYRVCYLRETLIFRNLLDTVPILCELDDRFKLSIFRNTMKIYNCFICVLNHVQHVNLGFDHTKYYTHPNVYLERNHHKIEALLMSNDHHERLPGPVDFDPFVNVILNCLRFESDCVAPLVAKLLNSPEDVAALILILIIHTNDFDKANSQWQRPINRLKELWNELDFFYRTTHRDPSSWGNLFFLLSNLESASKNFDQLLAMGQLYSTNAIYPRVLEAEEPEVEIALLLKEMSSVL